MPLYQVLVKFRELGQRQSTMPGYIVRVSAPNANAARTAARKHLSTGEYVSKVVGGG